MAKPWLRPAWRAALASPEPWVWPATARGDLPRHLCEPVAGAAELFRLPASTFEGNHHVLADVVSGASDAAGGETGEEEVVVNVDDAGELVVDLPAAMPARVEVGVVGRANVGKSTLLNTLLGRDLARTSPKAGKTQTLNFYQVGPSPLRIVDMPGYGKAVREAWVDAIAAYLQHRDRNVLTRTLLLVDARRGFQAVDAEIVAMFEVFEVPFHVVLTKVDTLKSVNALKAAVMSVQDALFGHRMVFPCLNVVSAATGEGLPELMSSVVHSSQLHTIVQADHIAH